MINCVKLRVFISFEGISSIDLLPSVKLIEAEVLGDGGEEGEEGEEGGDKFSLLGISFPLKVFDFVGMG